jgi:hypothetical protein
MPRGNRPTTAACTSLGARKASEIVILTCRMLHLLRAAICSALVTVPATISSSQCRPRAIDATSVARVSASNGSTVVRRHGRRRDDVASSLHVRLPPWDAQTPVSSSARLSLLRWFELDRQLVRLHLDADDMGTDEVSVSSWCRILEVLADGTSNEG